MKKYKIKQYPQNKDIPLDSLSIEQIWIRDSQNSIHTVPEDTTGKRKCKCCGKELPESEFYFKDRERKRLDTTCKDCRLKNAGILTVGKVRFSKALLKKNFRRCSICKQILPLSEFNPSSKSYGGYVNTCKECNITLTKHYRQKQQLNPGRFYLRQYGLRKGIRDFTDEVYDKLQQEVANKRTERYFIDGKGFVTVSDFADYMHSTYGIPVTTTKKRIAEGYTTEQCRLSQKEARSRVHTKGSIVVSDILTGKIFHFRNTRDEGLRKMFSTSAINRCIRTGEPTKITRLSKYPNPCTIQRITENERKK